MKRALPERTADTFVLVSAEALRAASPFQVTTLKALGLLAFPANAGEKMLWALRPGSVTVQRVKEFHFVGRHDVRSTQRFNDNVIKRQPT